jgi:hypothetical protein
MNEDNRNNRNVVPAGERCVASSRQTTSHCSGRILPSLVRFISLGASYKFWVQNEWNGLRQRLATVLPR